MTWGICNARQDPLQPYRHEFSPLVSVGEPPVSDHTEELFNDDAKLADWVRVRNELLRDPEFSSWKVEGDLSRVPLKNGDGQSHLLTLERPGSKEFLTLQYPGSNDGLELIYTRPFRGLEKDIAFFRGDR